MIQRKGWGFTPHISLPADSNWHIYSIYAVKTETGEGKGDFGANLGISSHGGFRLNRDLQLSVGVAIIIMTPILQRADKSHVNARESNLRPLKQGEN